MLTYREFVFQEGSPIQCVWELRGHDREQQRIAPDGRFEMIVHLEEPFEALGPDGWKRQSTTLVAGQLTQPLFVRAGGSTHAIGVRLKSWASSCITGVPASDLTNRVIDANELNRNLESRLRDAIANSARRLSQVAQRLLAGLGESKPADERIVAAVRQVEQTGGMCQMDQLARAGGVSGRQLERLFHNEVGVGPKTLARIRRFSRVFAQIEAGDANWANIAADCGYNDQSHLTRDFNQFAGGPPAALLSSASDLALCFTAAHFGAKAHHQ
jgi:methylphosphotriester-DNA--protein-cysteine methyltransferase